MNKLKYLISVSLSRKIKSKWFLIVNILLCVGISLLINIDSLIKFFGGDFNDAKIIYVLDNTKEFSSKFENNFKIFMENSSEEQIGNYDIVDSSENLEELKEKIKEKKEKNNVILVVDEDSENLYKVSLITNDYMEYIDVQLITNILNNTKMQLAIEQSDIDEKELNRIYNNISIERIILDSDKSSEDESASVFINTLFPLFILPFFMLTIILIQMIGAEVNDEKSTRGMEIIISNVSPGTHFASKVIASNIFVIGQALLLFLYLIIGILIRNFVGGSDIANGVINEVLTSAKTVLDTNIGSQLIYIIPIMFLLMILTFVAYSLLAGVLASMTTNSEDFQQLQTPMIIISLIGYYFAMMANLFKGSLFIKILSYIPLISSILSPSLLVLGQINIFDIIISFVLLILFIYILVKYGLRIYKVGILNYSSKDLWKKMFKALKK